MRVVDASLCIFVAEASCGFSGAAEVSLLVLYPSRSPLRPLRPASHMFFRLSAVFCPFFCVTASAFSVDAQSKSFMTGIKTRH